MRPLRCLFPLALLLLTATQWLSFEAGMERARRDHRPVFLFFYGPRCPYCQRSLQDLRGEVLQKALARFVAVRVDVQRRPDLARHFMIRGIPTVWILRWDGTPIAYIPGYVEPRRLAEVLNAVKAP